MGVVLLHLFAVFMVGFGIGYAVLRIGGGLYRGAGSRSRRIVGLLLVGCIGATLYEVHGIKHPHSSAEYAGLISFLTAIVIGTASLGLLCSLLLSLRPRAGTGVLSDR